VSKLSNSADSCGKPSDRPTAGRETILARIIFRENRFCHFATPSTADLCRAEAQWRRDLQQCSETYSGRPFTQRVMPAFITSPAKLSKYPSLSPVRRRQVWVCSYCILSIILTSAPLRLCARLIRMPIQFSFSFCYAIYGRPPSQGAEIAGNSSRLLCSFFENHKLWCTADY
jgi:hypothetical protein